MLKKALVSLFLLVSASATKAVPIDITDTFTFSDEVVMLSINQTRDLSIAEVNALLDSGMWRYATLSDADVMIEYAADLIGATIERSPTGVGGGVVVYEPEIRQTISSLGEGLFDDFILDLGGRYFESYDSYSDYTYYAYDFNGLYQTEDGRFQDISLSQGSRRDGTFLNFGYVFQRLGNSDGYFPYMLIQQDEPVEASAPQPVLLLLLSCLFIVRRRISAKR